MRSIHSVALRLPIRSVLRPQAVRRERPLIPLARPPERWIPSDLGQGSQPQQALHEMGAPTRKCLERGDCRSAATSEIRLSWRSGI
jgi:hypothetical protein